MADILGLLADAITGGVDWMRDPRRTQQMQGIGGLLADTLASASRHKGLMGQEAAYTQQAMKAGRLTDALRGGPAGAQLDKAVADAYNPAGITVYHGSPHRFTKFDASKIGTGEGAQAYGHGLYFAESPGVARAYANKLTQVDGQAISDQLDSRVRYLNVLRQQAAAGDSNAAKNIPIIEKSIADLQNKGSLYKVDLPDPAIARMLNWDAPLMQQGPEVKDRLRGMISDKKIGEFYNRAIAGEKSLLGLPTSGVTAEQLNRRMVQVLGQPSAASEALRSAGIPGIRYLDEGSRGAGQGTSNFVVFPGEEDLLRILSVNGGLLTP